MQHEDFIQGVRGLVLKRDIGLELRDKLATCKLTYGVGEPGLRGVTCYRAWSKVDTSPVDLIGISANGEESIVQLAGTTVHELAHVAAGTGAGHGISWKDSCKLLGLIECKAAGQDYLPEHFDTQLWSDIVQLGEPTDGNPLRSKVGGLPFVGVPTGKYKPCPLGIGTRGGQSRGPGSGSRMRLYHCQCQPVVKVRVASDTFDATCNVCQLQFQRVSKLDQDRWGFTVTV